MTQATTSSSVSTRTHELGARTEGDIAFQAAASEFEARLSCLPEGARVVRPEINPVAANCVTVGHDFDFCFIARKDGPVAVAPLMRSLAARTSITPCRIESVLRSEYDRFAETLFGEILVGLVPHAPDPARKPGKIEVHVYEPEPLEAGVRHRAAGMPLVSMDPLLEEEAHCLRISRLFCLSGRHDMMLTHRPGAEELPEQFGRIRSQLNGTPFAVTDDDVFTGGTLRRVLAQLELQPAQIVPQIQTGNPKIFEARGLRVDPVVQYEVHNRDALDIGDARDFLIGSSGLVIETPSGQRGRAPYLMPFVSPAARTSIQPEREVEFSLNVLKANRAFFKAIESELGLPITLADLDAPFRIFVEELYALPMDTAVTTFIQWAIDNHAELWENMKSLGETHMRLRRLELPQRMVFLDVNGTLIEEDLNGVPHWDPEILGELNLEVARLREEGIQVGLCSDSPLEPLQALGRRLGLTGPIIAENGNLIHHAGKTETLRQMSDIEPLRSLVRDVANSRYRQVQNVISPEFGGTPPDYARGEWGFGEGRRASVAVFGPRALISELGRSLHGFAGYSVDCSAEFNFLAIHPGVDYRAHKGETLRLLHQFGHTVMMVGNSKSDWVSPSSGVVCAFVGDARIDSEIRNAAAYVAERPLMGGVIEILSKVTGRDATE